MLCVADDGHNRLKHVLHASMVFSYQDCVIIINREILKFQVVPSCFRLVELFFHGYIIYMSKNMNWEGNYHRIFIDSAGKIKYRQMSNVVRYSSVCLRRFKAVIIKIQTRGARWARHVFW
jgi:hypothetical protein